VIKLVGGESVIEGEDSSLVNFFRKEFEPRRYARANFCGKAFDGRDRPTIDLVEKFGRDGLIGPVEAIRGLGNEPFMPLP